VTGAQSAGRACGAGLNGEEAAGGVPGFAEWLRLAATPAFAIMALLTGLDGRPADQLCSSGHWVPLNGMAVMYLLMSAFHSPPWLKLAFGRRGVLAAQT
jgi:hypothetical protein